MPLCGFNQKMLKGITAFHEGLVEYGLIKRSKLKNQSVDETLTRELADMNRFLAEIDKITDPQIRELTKALTKYAQAFYRLVNRKGINSYQQTTSTLNKYYAEMDRKFYKDLEGKPEDMKKLTEHLNKINAQLF